MDAVNAIGKVRFSSAKPQRVQLHKSAGLLAELICMEAGQELNVPAGELTYYVVMGTASISAGGQTAEIPPGHFAATGADEAHTISNAGEGRLVCLAVGQAS
jgi:mannose-6-phosphate isomerase-like protein (cupin superfamily)